MIKDEISNNREVYLNRPTEGQRDILYTNAQTAPDKGIRGQAGGEKGLSKRMGRTFRTYRTDT
jgi:hypothetical protein